MRSIAAIRTAFICASIAVLCLTLTSCTKNIPTQSISYSFTATTGQWTYLPATAVLPAQWYYPMSIPAITADILNNYAVLVYWTQYNQQTQMPFTITGQDFSYQMGLDNNNVGYVDVYVDATGDQAYPYDPSTPSAGNYPVYLKVVIIPQ
jgi:hypothetical protein